MDNELRKGVRGDILRVSKVFHRTVNEKYQRVMIYPLFCQKPSRRRRATFHKALRQCPFRTFRLRYFHFPAYSFLLYPLFAQATRLSHRPAKNFHFYIISHASVNEKVFIAEPFRKMRARHKTNHTPAHLRRRVVFISCLS